MAAMVVTTALIGAVCIIVWMLIAVFLREYRLINGLEREIASLKHEMSCVRALLVSMDGKEQLDVQRKIKLRDLSFSMEECISLFKYRLAEGDDDKPGQKNQLESLKVRHRFAKKIQTLKARVADEMESHRRERYGLNPHITVTPNDEQPPHVAIDQRLLSLYKEGADLVGIDRSKLEIIRWLMKRGPRASPRIRALSIEGSGGIGKSTLAKRVYHDIRAQFDCSVFVPAASASPRRSTKWILQEMLSGLEFHGDTTLRDTKDQLIDKIRKCLEGKRYLILIDGIWSEEAWNIISNAFIENNRSSVVITTTRHHNVASACQQAPIHGGIYKVEPLNHADSRRLFCRRVFNSDDGCPEHLRNTLDQIVKKCGGVPLIILSLAGTLANYNNVKLIENWEKMLRSLVYGLDTEPGVETMKRLLNLSYRDLCPNLRTCLLYLGMCSEYLVISKDDLMRRWIAEGFVSKAYGCTQEDIAESYFNQLINQSIIQATDFDELGQATSWQVHSVMLDFILSKAMEENFFTVADNIQQIFSGSAKVRRVYFHSDHAECDRVISSVDLSPARSLDFWACSKCWPSLSRFHLLRVLHLDISSMSNSPICDLTFICKLHLLRYLKVTSSYRSALSGSVVRRICALPDQIRTLRYLKTLDIDAYLLYGLPEDICKVSSLSNIIVSSSLPRKLPNGIGGLRDLQILKGFSILQCSVKGMQGIGDLNNLRELEVHLDAPDDVQEAAVDSMRKLDRLQSLVIHCGHTISSSCHLRYLCPPRGLQRLHVHGCFFDSVPNWMENLHMLTSLVLGVRNLSSYGLRVLSRLPNLVHFRLSIGEFDRPPPPVAVGAFWTTQHRPERKILICRDMFPRLKSFWFRYEAPCDLIFEPGAMPSLESFGVRFIAERFVRSAPVPAGIRQLLRLTSFTAHIDISSKENRAFIDRREVPHVLSLKERLWWKYVDSAECALRNAVFWHPARPRVHIKYASLRLRHTELIQVVMFVFSCMSSSFSVEFYSGSCVEAY